MASWTKDSAFFTRVFLLFNFFVNWYQESASATLRLNRTFRPMYPLLRRAVKHIKTFFIYVLYMANMNTVLPNGTADLYLTDGGLETTLVFLEGYELPCFAAFDLLKDE